MASRWRGTHHLRWIYPGAVLAVLAASAPVAAQDVVAAEGLFNRGVQQMKAGRYDDACPAIAESQRIDPRPGTLFTLAECEAKRGRIATALTHYRDYLDVYARLPADQQTRQRTREQMARKKKAELTPKVPELTLTLPPDAPKGTVVKRDGIIVPEGARGMGMAIDPGEHMVSTQAPDGPVTELQVKLAPGEKKSVVLEVKASLLVEAEPVNTGPSGRRIGAYVAGSFGIAGLIVGGVTGGLTLAKKGAVTDNCGIGGTKTDCNHAGKEAVDSAKRLGLASTIGIGIGIAGVGTALVLWLTEPSPGKGDGRSLGAYTAAGFGVAGLVIGGVMGGVTLAQKGTVAENCGVGGVSMNCNRVGKEAAETAQTAGLISTVAFGVGLTGVATAAVMWLTAPSPGKREGAERDVRVGVLAAGATGAVVGIEGVW